MFIAMPDLPFPLALIELVALLWVFRFAYKVGKGKA
jgi:hypothetical protein